MATTVPIHSDPLSTQKADQIAHKFFTKFALLVDNARAPEQTHRDPLRVDKWFNLETPDNDAYRDHLRTYRSISSLPSPPPPLEIQVLLTIPELTTNQVFVLHEPGSSRIRIEPTPTHVLLESWLLEFSPPSAASSFATTSTGSSSPTSPTYTNMLQRYTGAISPPPTPRSGEVTLATVYKHAMSLFRSLFTLLRVLPTWRLCKRLRRRTAGGGERSRNGSLGIEVRVAGQRQDHSGRTRILGFDELLSPHPPSNRPPATETHTFAPVKHPFGALSVRCTYITNPHFFALDTVESLLSSRFLSLEGVVDDAAFVPTLARNTMGGVEGFNRRIGYGPSNSNSNSPSTSPTGQQGRVQALSRSPPRAPSIAERFVLPLAGSNTSLQNANPMNNSSSATGRRGTSGGAQTTGTNSPAYATPAAAGSRTSLHSFPSTSPRRGNVALPPLSALGAPRTREASPARRSISVSSGVSAGPVAGTRLRNDSLGIAGNSRADLPSLPTPSTPVATGPMPIRRPPINPFKSSTLSPSSPSVLSPSRASYTTSSPLTTGFGSSGTTGRIGASSPPQLAFPAKMPFSGATAVVRPSPPNVIIPSNLGQGHGPLSVVESSNASSSANVQGSTGSMAKRYSSSFGHRYAPSVGGSDGSGGSGSVGATAGGGGSAGGSAIGIGVVGASSVSAGSGGSAASGSSRERDKERVGSSADRGTTSYFGALADDDDLSTFVQDIDARKPLGGFGTALGLKLSPSPEKGMSAGPSPLTQPYSHMRSNTEDLGRQKRPELEVQTFQHRRERTTSVASTNIGTTSNPGSPLSRRYPPIGPSNLSPNANLNGTRISPPLHQRDVEGGPGGAMLTSQVAVDARLKAMNEAFIASLAKIDESGGRRASTGGTSTSPAIGPRDALRIRTISNVSRFETQSQPQSQIPSRTPSRASSVSAGSGPGVGYHFYNGLGARRVQRLETVDSVSTGHGTSASDGTTRTGSTGSDATSRYGTPILGSEEVLARFET